MISVLILATSIAAESSFERIPAAVQEAALRSLLRQSERSSDRTLCLLVDGDDPSVDLSSLAGTSIATLVSGSQCYYKQLPNRREVALTLNGEPAEFLSLSSFERQSHDVVTVNYEYRAGSWTGTGSMLTLKIENGYWHALPQSGYNWVE